MFGYPYYYNSYVNELAILGSALILAFVISFILSIACYIFEAIGMYTISKKRGYSKPCLSFIPFANCYLFGAVADNINAVNGKKSNFRVWLLVLRIINAGIVFLYFIAVLSPMILLLVDYINYGYYSGFPNTIIVTAVFFAFILSAVSITYSILFYIVLHKIFTCYSRKNAVMFTVLNILFNIAPFILFAIRNNRPVTNAEYLQSQRVYYPQNAYYQGTPQQPYYPPQYQPQPPQSQQWQAQQMQQMQWQQQNQQNQQASQPPQPPQAQSDTQNNNDQ